MTLAARTLRLLEGLNDRLLAVGRQIAWVLVALMVATILLQVFRRYVMNDALPWPEEVARALMIWMMALVAGSGYRWGAFVSIDLVSGFLPPRVRAALHIVLLIAALLLLIQLFVLAIDFFQRGFRTRAASFQLARAWIYLAMPVCFGTMILVNIELLLRETLRAFGHPDDYPTPVNPLAVIDEAGVIPKTPAGRTPAG